MRLRTLFLGLAALTLSSPALGYDVNKDVENLSVTGAFDITVDLVGSEDVTGTYNATATWLAQDPQLATSTLSNPSGKTRIRFHDYSDNGDNIINTNEKVHIGWTTADHSSAVADMFWTDSNGDRIFESVVYNVTSGWEHTGTNSINVLWRNVFSPAVGSAATVTISNVMFVVNAAQTALADLNTGNGSLNASLSALPGGGSFTLAVDASTALPIPGSVSAGAYVVLRYDVDVAGSDGSSTDYIQFQTPVPAPSASHWTLGALVLMLLALATLFVLRRPTASA